MAGGKVRRSPRLRFEAEPYRVPWWLRGAHAQTIAGRLLRRPRPPRFRRERIETPDGDFLDLDHVDDTSLSARAPLVVLFHGLEGSARRGYAIHTYRELAGYGIRTVGLNFRSCSGETNRALRMYHSGETEDIRYVLRLLRERQPTAPLGVIGFSLGGNAMLKFLGEEGDAAPQLVDAAAAVSVPYDLDAGARHLESTVMGAFYTRRFLKSLVAKTIAKAELVGPHCDLGRVMAARTFRQFDDAATAPLHGFDSAEDYYRRSSSGRYLASIRVPTLLLHAEDDPFVPFNCFPHAAVGANPSISAIVHRRGGHVGFIDGQPWRPTFWAERVSAHYLAAQLAAAMA
jgi:uncharacterized protein